MAKKLNTDDVSVKKIKQDPKQFYAKLKYVDTWLLSPNKDIAPIIEDKKEFESVIRYKLYNNFLPHPKIVWYLNKYLNHLFQFHSFDPEDLLKTLADIIKCYGLKKGAFHFAKRSQFERDKFTNLIDKYCSETGLMLNNQEINNLYRLYEMKIINNEEMESIEEIVEGRERDKNKIIPGFTQPPPEIKINQDKSSEILQFTSAILAFKSKRSPCKNCSLAYKQSSVLDTNISSFSETPVDIAIVANETAFEEDVQTQSPLSGEDGKLFRSLFYKLVEKYNLKYVITNASLCYPDTKILQPPQLKKVMSDCRGMIDEVHTNFKPKLIILFGSNIKSSYGIKDKMSDINGGVVFGKYFCMTSPAEALKSKPAMERFQKAMLALDGYLANKPVNIVIPEDNKPSEEMVLNISSRIEKGDTLFNIEILGDKIVIILIDSKGKKKYITETIQFPVYIKSGQYKDCEYISDKFEAKVILTAREKQKLSAKLNQYIKNTIEC